MKKIAFSLLIFSAFISKSFTQTPTILINGTSVMASNVSVSPYWLGAGQTLAIGNLTKFISVLEYNVIPATGGNDLKFEGVLSVTTVQTVPSSKTWKIESVAVDPTASTFGGDNLGNHVATTTLNMNSNKISNLANPIASADAVNSATLQNGNLVYAADAGVANAYAVTLSPAPAAYTTGMMISFKAANTNTGASTLNVNALGPKPIKKQGSASDPSFGDIAAAQILTVVYDGTNFEIIGQLGNAAGGASHGQQKFTSNGSFIVPAGVTTVYVSMTGGGGSGGGGTNSGSRGGGGGGGAASALAVPVSVTPLASIGVTIGAGGNAVAAGANNGNAGTASSFGSFSTSGGGAGIAYANGGTAGAGGTGSTGTVAGAPGGIGDGNSSFNYGGPGGGTIFGHGGPGTRTIGISGSGYGAGGAGGGNIDAAGNANGGGSGSGAPGFVLVEW